LAGFKVGDDDIISKLDGWNLMGDDYMFCKIVCFVVVVDDAMRYMIG
jgi:hypothetical protein